MYAGKQGIKLNKNSYQHTSDKLSEKRRHKSRKDGEMRSATALIKQGQ